MRTPWTLVTGASGFIGSMVVRKLIERGVPVKAFVRPGASLEPFEGLSPDRFQLAYGDILVSHTIYRALAQCDRLYHVASAFRYWSRRPSDIIDPAVSGTRAVLEAVRRRDLARVVVTSSCAVLGTTGSEEPMDEQHENNLTDPEIYVRAKIEADRVVAEGVDAGLPVISVLPSAVFGPGDRKPTPNGHSLLSYLKLSPHRKVPATDGGVSVVDVEDVAEGHILAMEKGRVGERYILGGENLTYRDLFQLAHELTGLAEPGGAPSPGLVRLAGRMLELGARWTGKDPILTYRLARDYAYGRVWVTSAKAEQELGYSHRPARETLARAIRFYLANGYVPQPITRRIRLELRPV
jgi:dihydroflavonol-4-reductase